MVFLFLAAGWTAWILPNRLPLGSMRSRIFSICPIHVQIWMMYWVYRQLPCKREKSERAWKYRKDLCGGSLQYFHLLLFFLIFLSISLLAWLGARNILALKANGLSFCPGDLSLDVCLHGSDETRATADLCQALTVRKSKTQPLCSAWSQTLYRWPQWS